MSAALPIEGVALFLYKFEDELWYYVVENLYLYVLQFYKKFICVF